MPAGFELHVGFVRDDVAEAFRLEKELRNLQSGWNLSEVTEVYDHVSSFDPHNVPGQLALLLSHTFATTEAKELLDSASAMLALLEDVPASRLELEFAYGEADVVGATDMAYAKAPALSLPEWPNAERIDATPAFEIHFVASSLNLVQPATLAGILIASNLTIVQTISYRSARMRRDGTSTTNLISTAYYPDESALFTAVNTIRTDKALGHALPLFGITVTLRPERVYACYKPTERK